MPFLGGWPCFNFTARVLDRGTVHVPRIPSMYMYSVPATWPYSRQPSRRTTRLRYCTCTIHKPYLDMQHLPNGSPNGAMRPISLHKLCEFVYLDSGHVAWHIYKSISMPGGCRLREASVSRRMGGRVSPPSRISSFPYQIA